MYWKKDPINNELYIATAENKSDWSANIFPRLLFNDPNCAQKIEELALRRLDQQPPLSVSLEVNVFKKEVRVLPNNPWIPGTLRLD
jgi:hypothetical protein